VRLVGATVYALEIPLVEAFRHSARARSLCDSVVVRVRDERGSEGFGEGVPRPYVTGETVESTIEQLGRLWPAVASRELPEPEDASALEAVESWLPPLSLDTALADNATRAALETAVLDCLLRRTSTSLGRLLPPVRPKVAYSGVITAGSLDGALEHARRMRLVGLASVKVKVGFEDDVSCVRAVREALGESASLRLDANGAWSFERALEVTEAVAPCRIAAVEQPLPRGPIAELARLREATSVPLMADESLVTLADADELIDARAVDYFNLRISKCGGLARSLRIARRAASAGVGLQLGSQVGETAILSAAGRHLAAHLPDVSFVEGSYGTLLLTEDVSAEGIRFGHRGEAPLLSGPGLGIRVVEERLRKYARRVVELEAGGAS
jgi:muconate cycloisomerase